MKINIIEIFYFIDEFCKEYEKIKKGHELSSDNNIKKRNRQFTMSDSEVITILITFHINQYRNLKHYYINHIQNYCRDDFPQTVYYNRFVELQEKALPLLVQL